MKEGDTVGRYRLGRVLGTGGMGTVFVAHDPELDRDVALKVLALDDDASLVRVRRRLAREAQALASVSDPHVVQVFDAGMDGAVLFISMELVEGGDLVAWLDADKRTTEEILEVFTAAGRGLAAAHARGVIHRDFKPANVLLGKDGRVRVVDFGLARLLSDVDSEHGDPTETPSPEAVQAALTIPGAVLGTPAYMSPEQHMGLELDARTDQYSFCVALFEAVHGRRPFGGTVKQIAREKAAYTGTDSRKNPILQAVIDRGLAPRRRDRFESMHAVLTAFGQVPPAAGRRWPLLAAVGVLALLVQIGVMVFVRPELPRGCAPGGLDAVWSPARVDALRTSFAVSGHFAAGEYAGHVIAQLDNYAERWGRAYEQGCADEATVACLRDARGELAGHVQRYTGDGVDTGTLLRAPEELAELPAPEGCAQEAHAFGGSAQERVLVGELRALTSVPSSPRDPVATRKRIEQILAAAAEHGYAGVEAHGQLALSTALAWADDPDAAAAAAERAHLLAAERGDDRLALEAAARGSSLAAKRQRDAERVTWNARVDALLDRLDARGTRLHGKVLAELGLGAVNVGQIVEAVELYGQAHQIARAFPEETTTLIVASYRYGIALGATHANEEALPYLEESLGLATALLGPQSIPAGDALAGSCTSLDALGQHREAIDVCRRALDVILRYRAADSVSGVQTRLRLAQALRNAGDWDEAIAVATKAVLLIDGREAEPTLLRGQAHLFLGSTLHAASRYAEAIVELQRGADLIATSIGRSNATYAEALGVIAMAQLDSGDPVAAEATQRRVVATLEGRATTPYERVTAHADLARILRAQGRPSDALAELETVRGEIAFVSAAQTRGDALLLLAQSIADVDPKRRPEARDLARAAAEAYKEAGGRFLAYAQDADAFVRSEP